MAITHYTVDDFIWYLRNGKDNGPFLKPKDIPAQDGFKLKIRAIDEKFGLIIEAPLDEKGEIVWEDWTVIEDGDEE